MKTYLGIVVGFVMILFITTTAFSASKKNPKTSTSNNPAGVTYVVEVDPANAGGSCHTYCIILTNKDGVAVDAPKVFQEGITTYVFHENGHVSGTRIAHMKKINSSNPDGCNQVLYTLPVEVTNNFRSGSTYLFNLKPTLNAANN